MSHRVMSWDYREQIDLDELTAYVGELFGDRVHLTQVDTGSDQYVVVISNEPVTAEQAYRLWMEEQ